MSSEKDFSECVAVFKRAATDPNANPEEVIRAKKSLCELSRRDGLSRACRSIAETALKEVEASIQRNELAARMGVGTQAARPHDAGKHQVFPTMTREERQSYLASRKA